MFLKFTSVLYFRFWALIHVLGVSIGFSNQPVIGFRACTSGKAASEKPCARGKLVSNREMWSRKLVEHASNPGLEF